VPAKKILIVDDSATHRSLLKVFLGGHDFIFLEADEALSALRMLDRSKPDLVIVDLKMPGMSGFEFVRTVRSSMTGSLSTVPIVLLTAEKSSKLPQESAAVGASAFLNKPVSSAGILQVIKRLLHL
jgi:CheY-like chemotaxis protein